MAKSSYNRTAAAEKIAKWQHDAGLQGREIAKRVGISAPYYSDIRKGKQRGSIEVLAGIAEVLGHSVEDLLVAPPKEDAPTFKVTDLRKALRPFFGKQTHDVVDGIQLWLKAPQNVKKAFQTLVED